MGYSDKYSLVKKAAKIDLDTDRGYVEFLKIAKESGLTKERLEYYTNAYEASGESGLRALSYRKRMPEDIRCSEFCQMRYADFDNRWHLYWKRKTGKWGPYVPKKTVYTISDCLREVDEDGWGCFWG